MKAACGLAIDATAFPPTVLTYWRRRLAASERPHLIFEVIRELIATTGAVAGKQRRALDSTVLDDAVARQDTVTQLIAPIRQVGRDVAGAKDLIGAHCTRLAALTGQDYTATGKPRIAWDDRGVFGTSWSPHWSTTRLLCWGSSTQIPQARKSSSGVGF